MPGENEMTSLDSIASSLISGGEQQVQEPARNAKVSPSAQETEEEEQDTNEADDAYDPVAEEVDPADVDLLEGDVPEGDDQQDEEDFQQVDPDEIEHEVVVDGKPAKAKLKDLKAAYSGNKAIDQRLQQAGEFRKQSEVLATELIKQLNVEATKLKQLDTILAEAERNGVDFENLRITDPQRYLIEKDKLQELQNKRRAIAAAAEENAKREQMIRNHQMNEYAKNEADALMVKMPELRNPEKAKAMSEHWNKTAAQYGFKTEEVESIIDHRMLLVLTDAAKYRALVNAKAARQGKGSNNQRVAPKPLLRPGTQNFGQKMNAVKAEKAAIARAEKTGTVDDVAATLIVNAPIKRPLKKTGY